MGKQIQTSKKAGYGHLKPTRENFDAWARTLDICKILNANVCVIQCPPSFGFSRRNVDNVRRFLGQIDRGNTKIAWEPRGNWKEHANAVKKLCNQLDIIHAVDILRSEAAVSGKTSYFRLHGIGPRDFNYKYNYSRKDLERLRESAVATLRKAAKQVFIMFNSVSMLENAKAFQEMTQASGADWLTE